MNAKSKKSAKAKASNFNSFVVTWRNCTTGTHGSRMFKDGNDAYSFMTGLTMGGRVDVRMSRG